MPFALSTPSVTTLFPAHGEIITPSDVTDYSDTVAGGITILAQVAGDIVVDPADGSSTVTLTAWPAHTFVPFRVDRVLATGTTATGILGVW